MKKSCFVFYCLLLFFTSVMIIEAKKVTSTKFVVDDATALVGVEKTNGGFIAYGSFPHYNNENPEQDSISTLGGLIIKYDLNGNFVWDYRVENGFTMFNSLKEDKDGNFIGVGSYSDPAYGMVVKIDKNGNELWQKIYSNEESVCDYCYSVFNDVEVTDDGYIIVGYVDNKVDGINVSMPYITKLNKNGDIIWTINDFELLSKSGNFNDILSLGDDKYVVVGSAYENADSKNRCGFIVELNEDGTDVLEHKLCNSGVHVGVNKIINNDDNYLAIVSNGDISSISSLDKEFNILNSVDVGKYEISDFEQIYGGFVISGVGSVLIEDSTGQIGFIAYLDNQFNILESEVYDSNIINAVGKFLIDGNSVYVPRFNTIDTWCLILCASEIDSEIIKYDLIFDIEKKESINGTYVVEQEGELGKIVVTPDEGYVLDAIKIVDAGGKDREYYEKDGNYYFELEDGLVINVTYKELPKFMEDVKNPVTSIFIPLAIYIGLSALVVFIISMIKLKIQKNYLSL